MLTEGLVQAGWCGSDHGCDESQENGVGDSETSWSFGRSDERVTWNRYSAREEVAWR